jgi:hypothetical protein
MPSWTEWVPFFRDSKLRSAIGRIGHKIVTVTDVSPLNLVVLVP